MAGREPEHLVGLPVLQQAWRDVAFLHWACPPEALSRHLPRGFEVDTFDGTAWVGLTPFRVAGCSPGPIAPLAGWAFPETNLRTYVIGPDGVDGIWFLSIEAATVAVTVGARLMLGVPYHYAAMAVRREGPVVRYRSRRCGLGDARHDIRVRPGERLGVGERAGLVDWLTGRWRSWTTHAGVAVSSPVQHQPWPLHHGELVSCDESISTAAGLDLPDDQPLVHFSPGVDVRFGRARPRGWMGVGTPG